MNHQAKNFCTLPFRELEFMIVKVPSDLKSPRCDLSSALCISFPLSTVTQWKLCVNKSICPLVLQMDMYHLTNTKNLKNLKDVYFLIITVSYTQHIVEFKIFFTFKYFYFYFLIFKASTSLNIF